MRFKVNLAQAHETLEVEVMEKFIPVLVKGGRKFQGEAYDIGSQARYSYFNVYGSGRNGWRTTETIKLWSPTEGFVYCNLAYINDREVVDEEQVKADFVKYTDSTLQSTIEWCARNVRLDEDPLVFAMNVIRKHHPEMLEAFHSVTNGKYRENIEDTIKSTIAWAFNLGYRSDKSTRIAYRALVKKGMVGKDGFATYWTNALTLRGAEKYANKYLAA